MANVEIWEIADWLSAQDENRPMPGTRQGGCPSCERVGLPILPVRYAVSDRHVSHWSQDLPWSMAVYANRHFPAPREARYTLRLMREGYLYLFDEKRQRWQAWYITEDSRFDEFDPRGRIPGASNEDAQGSAPCNVPENNLSARLISLPNADEATIVHVGYSDHPLTQAMLGRLERNDNGLRDRLLKPFDVAAWLGAAQADGAIPAEDLEKYVMEFSNYYPSDAQEDDGFRFLSIEDRCFSTAPLLHERMNWMVRDFSQWIDKTPILAVDDPIGICISINHFRNNAMQRLDRYARRKEVVERKVTSELIEGLRTAVESRAEHQADLQIERIRRANVFGDQQLAEEFDALGDDTVKAQRWALMGNIDRARIERGRRELEILRGQQQTHAPEYRRRAIELSWDKYLACYDDQERRDFESRHRAHVERDSQAVEDLAVIHRDWLMSDLIGDAMLSYDIEDLDNGDAYEVAVAAMTVGMSMTETGLDVISELVDRSIDDPESYLWRAMFVNHGPAIDMLKDMAFEGAFWGSKIIGPLRRLLGEEREHRSQTENMVANMTGVLARRLGMVSSTEIANNTLARLWQAVGWARYGMKVSLMHFEATPSQLVTMYDRVLWRDEIAIRTIRHDFHHFFPPLPDGQREQPIRLWSFVPTALDPQQRAIIQAELAESIELRRLAVSGVMKPSTWFGLFAASLEIINAVRLGETALDDSAAESQTERNWMLAGGLLYLASSVTGVANTMIHPVAVPDNRLFKGLAWGAGITGALGAWIFSVWHGLKAYQAFKDEDWGMSVLYSSSSLIFFASGASALAAVAQQVGKISATEAAIGSLIISRSGWALVASRLGWIGLAVALLIVVFEKNQLETWLSRCVFGKGEPGARYRDLQAALDALDDMTR